jgi:hypothetical protein
VGAVIDAASATGELGDLTHGAAFLLGLIFGDMSASFVVPANSGVGLYLRLVGVQGGATQFSYSALVTKKRWKA